MMTTTEWPIAKKKPTLTGRLPSCISLRVTLSMAAIWSASTALAQAETVGEQRGAEEHYRVMAEGVERPRPYPRLATIRSA